LETRRCQGIATVQKTGVLHDQRGLFSRQIGTGANPDAFLFAAKRDMFESGVAFYGANDFHHLFIRQSGDKIDSSLLEPCDDLYGVLFGVHLFGPAMK
jgi:hypothetical protein